MPNPNCTGQVELDLGVIDFGRLGRREVQGCFDGGSMTSDAGVMLLSATDRTIGLTTAAARCIADPRNPLLITHAVRDMLHTIDRIAPEDSGSFVAYDGQRLRW